MVSGLLGEPEFVGVGSDDGEMYPARAQFDEEEHIDGCNNI
jgi:hypothetical protein